MTKTANAETCVIDTADLEAITSGQLGDPFAVLGPFHRGQPGCLVAYDPHATWMEARIGAERIALTPLGEGVFAGDIGAVRPYLLAAGDGVRDWQGEDPYRFGPALGDLDLYLLGEGTHRRLWQALGAHPVVHEGVAGVRFAVWAPNARRVSVVGDFNAWDGRRAPMRNRGGVWELFLPGLGPGARYKFEVLPQAGPPLLKADPCAQSAEVAPATASVVAAPPAHPWADGDWMASRAARNAADAPIAIYEAHLGSWRGDVTGYASARALVDHAANLGFTHLELMPLAEFPFGGSWGYQPTGLYAPTARWGSPDDLRGLVDYAHQRGLGVIADWVPAHFPADAHSLARFDGTPLYEHADPREGFHPDWNTLIYNFGRTEVANFLSASALYWLEAFHLDGLRVDAVASMLYRDYSRTEGQWIPNRDGGRENLEAIAWLRAMNALVAEAAPPGARTWAEESTAWPGVTAPPDRGGLGFGFKWNMGWMNDTLRYMGHDPVHRSHHHDLMTFGLIYGFSEAFVLPLSHDEVVHGKGSLLGRMPGPRPDRFANLRAYYGFMWGHPGKKLLFMGSEFAQWSEWNHDVHLDWACLADPLHAGMMRLVGDLNALYRAHPALWRRDREAGGFAWTDLHARAESVLSWLRWGAEGEAPVAVVANFTPVARRWRLGLPRAGAWREALNTDSGRYGGQDRGNLGRVMADGPPHNGQPASAEITLPPLATLFLTPET